jgi:hypothetical protein
MPFTFIFYCAIHPVFPIQLEKCPEEASGIPRSSGKTSIEISIPIYRHNFLAVNVFAFFWEEVRGSI